MILETAAIFVGLYVAGIYHEQLNVMQGQLGEIIKQYPEIKKGADASVVAGQAATQTLNEITKQFRIGQRAWVGAQAALVPNAPSPEKMIAFRVVWKNTGLTPALNAHVEGGFMYKDRDYLIESDFSKTNTGRLEKFDQSFDRKRTSRGVILPNAPEGSSTTSYIQIPQANKYLFIAGTVSYEDIFGHPHTTLFCNKLQGYKLQGYILPLCNIHNNMN